MTDYTPEYLAARNAAMLKYTGGIGHDDLDPKGPSGHAYGLGVSTKLTSYYRRTHRKQAVDVTPHDVIECLVAAGVKNWVLMGLHGYVGYLPMPRATQDVDVLVPYSQKNRASKAIADRWPMLQQIDLSQVVRFMDPGDLDTEGKPKPVIDIMLPWGKFQETILAEHVVIDSDTGNRIPTVEAAIVAKYAAIVRPVPAMARNEYEASDMRRMMNANRKSIDPQKMQSLANEVWDQGGREILEFFQLAQENKPFPI